MDLKTITTHLTTKKLPCRNDQRGSTLLLVLAMLSILLLLAIAFSYGTRLETQASNNYAELSQARIAAQTGLPMTAPMIAEASQGLTTTLQPWSVVPSALDALVKQNGRSAGVSATQMAMLNQAGVSLRRDSGGQVESGPQATVQIRDLSGMTNINAIENAAAMARVVQAIVPGGDSIRKAQALIALREANSESKARSRNLSEENPDTKPSLDPRDPDADILDSLAQLRYAGNSNRPLFTDEEIQKLEKFVTVFSQAPEAYNAPDGTHVPRVSLHAIDAEVVYERLKKAFPHKKEELLLQFAANVADFSDEDDEPTILDSGGKIIEHVPNMATANVTLGVEKVAMISEVYPDALTSVQHGDDGQFVEISNPWGESISLSGWTLRTPTGTVSLSATLPAGGVLIITDNYNQPASGAPTGEGSLVSIFGATADGASRQVQVEQSLELPDRNGQVTLFNNQGKMVDFFAYDGSNPVDSKMSFQRPDPVVRGWRLADATPFATMNVAATTADMRTLWADGNTTMTKLSQLFQLSTGFAEKGEVGQTVVHAPQVANLTVPETIEKDTDPFPTNLDLRLVDVFTASIPDSLTTQPLTEDPNESNRRRTAAQEMKEFRERLAKLRAGENMENLDEQTSSTTTSLVHSYGKLNINTCSKFALLGLDLGTAGGGQNGMAGVIEKFEAHRITKLRQNQAPFQNVSEFIRQFGPELHRGNLAEIDKITDQVSVGSSSFEITATNRLTAAQQKALESGSSLDGPRPATATARWVISMDKQPYEIISFTLIP